MPDPSPAAALDPFAGDALVPSREPSPALRRVEAWLVDHRTSLALAILLVSLLLRLAHFASVRDGFQSDLHRYDQTDMNFFHAWAASMAAGDWLTDTSLHPLHGWHEDIAREHFQRVPSDPAAPRAGATQDEQRLAAKALWDRWYGGKRLHQEPLYPLALALTRVTLGPDVRWVFAWQLALGAVVNLLLFAVAWRCLGAIVGAVTGVLAVLSPLPLHYETTLLRTAPATFLCVLFAWLLCRALERRTLGAWALTGCCGGVAVLLQSNLVLLCAGALAVLMLQPRDVVPWRGKVAQALVLFVSAVAWLAPIALRNAAVGVPGLAMSSVGAITFIRANASDVPPDAPGHVTVHAARIMDASGGRLGEAAPLTLRTHEGLGSVLRMEWGKARQVMHWFERPNNTSFYFDRIASLVLRWLPLTWHFIAPLALVGFVLACADWRRSAPLLVVVLALLVPLLAFHVLSRYRSGFAFAALPLAALTIASVARWVSERRWQPAAAALVAVGLAAAWTSRPLPEGRLLVRASDVALAHAVHHGPRIAEAERRGDRAAVAREWDDLARLLPPLASELGPARPPRSEDEVKLAGLAAGVSSQRARAQERADELAAASRPEGPARATHDGPDVVEDSLAKQRDALLRELAQDGIRDAVVLGALERVPRERFVPSESRGAAYGNFPLPIGLGQTISQPYIVAFMTEAAQLERTSNVLEVGTGSGYQAAVLAEVLGLGPGVDPAKPHGRLCSIEILPELAASAEKLLGELGYRDVAIRAGDGYRGWPERAPFDAIVVTAAPGHVPLPLKEQLVVGGRLVIPVGDEHQTLLVITRTAQGYEERSLLPVRFVPMTGEAER